jgi:hypothetical protein
MRLSQALVFALALAFPSAVSAAAPSLVSPGVVFPAFSPNNDHVQDTAVYFFTLASDSALVTVLVHADSLGFPGAVVDTLLAPGPDSAFVALGPDTLQWSGNKTTGTLAADGRYWITAHAANVDGTSDASAVSILLDTVAPRDTLTTPTRTAQPDLVHEVAGKAWDTNGLERLVLTLFSEGRALADTICAPCAPDTTSFDVFVPDSLALTDTLRITIDARDPAGNGRPRSVFVLIDSLPPPPPVIDPIASPIDRDSVAVLGTASEAESVFVTFDGAVVARERVLGGFRFDVRLRRFAQGTHTVVAQSRDKAGNLSPPSAPVTFVYQEALGVVLPERFVSGQYLQVNLSKPANAVLLRIYDLTGRLVRRLEDRSVKSVYEFAWDLSDQSGNPVGSGPYVVGVEADYTDGSRLAKRLAMVVTR